MFSENRVLKNFAKFTGKHLRRNLFFNKVEKKSLWSLFMDGVQLPRRLVFSRFFDIRGNLGNVKEKPTRKTCFSREKKRLAPRIYQAKFCLAAFL